MKSLIAVCYLYNISLAENTRGNKTQIYLSIAMMYVCLDVNQMSEYRLTCKETYWFTLHLHLLVNGIQKRIIGERYNIVCNKCRNSYSLYPVVLSPSKRESNQTRLFDRNIRCEWTSCAVMEQSVGWIGNLLIFHAHTGRNETYKSKSKQAFEWHSAARIIIVIMCERRRPISWNCCRKCTLPTDLGSASHDCRAILFPFHSVFGVPRVELHSRLT